MENESTDHKITTNVNIVTNPIQFDYGLMEQSIINILHNCITYTPAKTDINIELKEENNSLIIEISDNGPGFPEESLDKLFEKFYRVPGSKTGGTGLGLSIAKGFIEAHGGTIKIGNRKDKGAIFIIEIPIKN